MTIGIDAPISPAPPESVGIGSRRRSEPWSRVRAEAMTGLASAEEKRNRSRAHLPDVEARLEASLPEP